MSEHAQKGGFNMQLPEFCDVMNFLHIISVLFLYCVIITFIFYFLYKYDQYDQYGKRIDDERSKDIEQDI